MPSRYENLPTRWPLVQTPENRDDDTSKDAQLVNCYAEKGVKDGEYKVIKRPGYSSTAAVTHGTGKGMYFWSTSISGGMSLEVYASELYQNGTILIGFVNLFDVARFTEMGFATGLVVLTSGYGVAYYTDGTIVTQITDVDFPTDSVLGLQYLNGRLYALSRAAANIHGSDLEDPSAWDPLNIIQAGNIPGQGVYLLKHLSYLVALKEFSTEAFYDAGNPTGSPLARLDGGISNWGCAFAESVQTCEDYAFWVSWGREGGPQLVKMDNLHITPVSTPPVERLLASISRVGETIRSWVMKIDGHRFYGLTALLADFTLVYDIDQNLWYRWADTDGGMLDIVAVMYYRGAFSESQWIQLGVAGERRRFGTCFEYPSDGDEIFSVEIVTPNFDAGVDRIKHLPIMRFNADKVAGSEIQVRFNDNDYEASKWSNFRTVSLDRKRPFLDQNGSFHKRALHLRHQKATSFRISSLDLQLNLGTL